MVFYKKTAYMWTTRISFTAFPVTPWHCCELASPEMCALTTAKQNSGSSRGNLEADLLQPDLVTGSLSIYITQYVKIRSPQWCNQRLLPLNCSSLFLFRHQVLLSHWPSPVSATWSFIQSHLLALLDHLICSSLVSFTSVTFISKSMFHWHFF